MQKSGMQDTMVFEQVASYLISNPAAAYTLNLDQLEAILATTILPDDIYGKVRGIVDERKIHPDGRPYVPVKPKTHLSISLPPAQSTAARPAITPIKSALKLTPIIPKTASGTSVASGASSASGASGSSGASGVTPIKSAIKLTPKLMPKIAASSASAASASASASVSAPAAAASALACGPPGHIADLVRKLNSDYHSAIDFTDQQLHDVLQWAEDQYYNPVDELSESECLADGVYDYIKIMYNKRISGTDNLAANMKTFSVTGVGSDKPSRDRDAKLPFYLGSLDNVFKGEGHVAQWMNGRPTHLPVHISAKMDGISALYHKGHLYTRGNALMGRDISHVVPYISTLQSKSSTGPIKVNYSVRGELVMRKSVFDNKYKGKKSSTGRIRKVNRNSVAGALGSINNIDYQFVADLEFIVYEILQDGTQPAPSRQFAQLEADGFTVAHNLVIPASEVNDSNLAQLYDWVLHEYDYHADGLVIRTDQPYQLAVGRNPDYAKAFKDPLPQDTAITVVTDIEWNPSQYGYLVPTIVYEPVYIHGVELKRTTGHNARDVEVQGLGPGAQIEIIYWGMVNPRINKVLKPVKPYLPDPTKVSYVWTINDRGEKVNIKLTAAEETPSDDASDPLHTVAVKRIHKALEEIGAKGVGETIVQRIYNSKPHMNSVGAFFNIKMEDIEVLGRGQASLNVYNAIHGALRKIDLPTLMAASKVFGRGMGAKKFGEIFKVYPHFMSEEKSKAEYISMLNAVPGFGDKTTAPTAEAMKDFWDFITTNISDELMVSILDNTEKIYGPKEASHDTVKVRHPDLDGAQVYLTGFRDAEMSQFIVDNGGTVQSGFSGKTTMVVRKDEGCNNNKTQAATAKGIRLLTATEFRLAYMM